MADSITGQETDAERRRRLGLNPKTSSITSKNAQQGQELEPATAAGVEALGATKKQVEMAQSPQRQAKQAKNSVAQAEKIAQTRNQQESTGLPPETAQRSATLKRLGDTGTWIQSLVNSRLESAQNDQVLSASGETGDLEAELASNPDNQEARAQLAQSHYQNLISEGVSVERAQAETDAYISDVIQVSSQGDAAAEALDETSSVQDLMQQSEEDWDSIAQALGTDLESLQGMSIQELQTSLEETKNEEFAQVQDLTSQMSDTSLSPALRQEAARQLRQLGATGIYATEAEIDTTLEEVAEGQIVTFAGQEMSLEDALSDSNISSLATRWSLLDEESRTDLEEELGPQLTDFLKRNESTIKEAALELEEATEGFFETQEANRTLGQLEGGEVSSDALKAIGIDIEGYSATELESDPLLEALRTSSVSEQQDIIADMNELADLSPEVAAALGGLTDEQIDGLMNDREDTFTALNRAARLQDVSQSSSREDIVEALDPEADFDEVRASAVQKMKLGLPLGALESASLGRERLSKYKNVDVGGDVNADLKSTEVSSSMQAFMDSNQEVFGDNPVALSKLSRSAVDKSMKNFLSTKGRGTLLEVLDELDRDSPESADGMWNNNRVKAALEHERVDAYKKGPEGERIGAALQGSPSDPADYGLLIKDIKSMMAGDKDVPGWDGNQDRASTSVKWRDMIKKLEKSQTKYIEAEEAKAGLSMPKIGNGKAPMSNEERLGRLAYLPYHVVDDATGGHGQNATRELGNFAKEKGGSVAKTIKKWLG